MKKNFPEKDAKLKGYVVVNDDRIQESYYEGQYDWIASVKLEVQQNLQVYFSKGWFTALDKMQVETSFSLRKKSNILITQELVIIPNPKIQAIIKNELRISYPQSQRC